MCKAHSLSCHSCMSVSFESQGRCRLEEPFASINYSLTPSTFYNLHCVRFRSHLRSFVRLFAYHRCRPRFLDLQYHPGCDWAQKETTRVCFCSISHSRPNCHSSVVPALLLADLEEQLTNRLVAYKQVTKHLVFSPKANDRWPGSFPIFNILSNTANCADLSVHKLFAALPQARPLEY
jgi:hypothetical protein